MYQHHNSWNPMFTIAASVICIIGSTGCQQPVRDRGTTNQVAPDQRVSNSGRLGSKELEDTTDAMVASIIAAIPDLKHDESGRTVIVADTLINKSAYPDEDLDIFMADLRAKLNQSGARYHLVFVENPDKAAGVRNRVLEDGLKDDYRTPGMRPNYALTGDVYAMDQGNSRYWKIFFRLLDLDPNSKIRNEIRWEDSKGYLFIR